MPDPSTFDRGSMLAHLAPSKGSGGIVPPSPSYKGRSVEIRPPKWGKKIWIGKLETLKLARYVADAVYYYLGMPPFHFGEGVMTLPDITCIGTVIGTPVELSNQELRVNYARKIAKGKAFEAQRDDFILKVTEVVKNPAFPLLASSQTEVVVLDDDDRDREDDFVYDENAELTLRMSSHTGSGDVPVAVHQTHVAGPNSGGGSQAVQAFVPSFGLDSNGPEKILRSANQSISGGGFSMFDCPTNSPDVKDWIESIEELDKFTAAGACTPSVVSDDGDELSPIFKFLPNCRPCALTSSKVLGNPVEPVLGSSSGWPSVEFTVNAKIRRIGD